MPKPQPPKTTLREVAACTLALDLLTFAEDVADFSGNADLQIRARVLVCRVGQELKKLEKREEQCGG